MSLLNACLFAIVLIPLAVVVLVLLTHIEENLDDFEEKHDHPERYENSNKSKTKVK